jgi:hypothetical protein
MKRLKKLAEDNDEDLMSFDEAKEETIKALENMESLTNEWSIRDTLKDLTNADFYNGEQMLSLDPTSASEVCRNLLSYVQGLTERDIDILFEIEDKVYRYAH